MNRPEMIAEAIERIRKADALMARGAVAEARHHREVAASMVALAALAEPVLKTIQNAPAGSAYGAPDLRGDDD